VVVAAAVVAPVVVVHEALHLIMMAVWSRPVMPPSDVVELASAASADGCYTGLVGEAGDDRELLDSQIAYYRRLAREYDATYGEDLEAARARITNVLDLLEPRGRVLEIACGTGMWTQELADRTDQLVGVDAAAEALVLARDRLPVGAAQLLVADVFEWEPAVRFDAVFMAFWLSHVPRSRWDEFFERLGDWLLPGGRILIVDEHLGGQAAERFVSTGSDIAIRTLSDGSEHRLVKVYLDPPRLKARLGGLGWGSESAVDGFADVRDDDEPAGVRSAHRHDGGLAQPEWRGDAA
jgi:SAM-dependent methyltransferase